MKMFEVVSRLYDRATGGAEVAADPNNRLDDFWPRAEDAAGVAAAKKWFKENISNNTQVLYFLVGAPGGGKSHISSELVQDLVEIDAQNSNLAHRQHSYKILNRKVLLINDATIRDDNSADNSSGLVNEIEACLDNGDTLVACVNRGILVEETAQTRGSKSSAGPVLDWISDYNAADPHGIIKTITSSSYLKFGSMIGSQGVKIELCVSYVDACSLFENSPVASYNADESYESFWVLGDYRLTQLPNRQFMDDPGTSGASLIFQAANKLMQEVLDESPKSPGTLDQNEAILFNPVLSNLENLTNPVLVNNLGTLVRAAEIASGQKFSFREVWGLLSRGVIGDSARFSGSCEIGSKIAGMQPDGSAAKERFSALAELGGLRYHQAIFGVAGMDSASLEHSFDPVTGLMNCIDPVKDGAPGKFDRKNPESGWVTPLLDSFTGSFAASSPLEELCRQVSTDLNDVFPLAVTDFERDLDKAFVELMASTAKDNDRRDAIRWYATYLSRLYAVANGIPAFRGQLAKWILIWITAPHLPENFSKQIGILFRPSYRVGEAGPSYIPLYESRTVPLTSTSLIPKLSMRIDELSTKVARSGDSLVLKIEEQKNEVAQILLDFSLLRAIDACTTTHVGVADVSSLVAPRIERMRASRLMPAFLAKRDPIAIVSGNKIVNVVISA